MIYHKPTSSLILKLKDPERVTEHIPSNRARVVEYKGKELVQVKLGIDEARVLRNVGIKAPSPIRYEYNWPSRYPSPFEHQITTSEFFTLNRKAICLNDMGSGKTLSAIWAADYLMDIGVIRKAVILAPLSTLESVWTNEIHGHLMWKRKAVVVHGDKKRREKALAQDADFFVINHHGAKTNYDALVKRDDIDLWIIDEAAVFRNSLAGMFKTVFDLIPEAAWVWLMTGTPLPKAPTDAFALGKLLRNPTMPKYFNGFKNETMIQVSPFKWAAKPGGYDRAYEVLQPGIRFRKEDCIDLPPVVFTHRECALTAEQTKMYKQMHDMLVAAIGNEPVSAANAAVKLQKLLQILTGVVYGNDGTHNKIDASTRLATCAELVAECQDKAIIFVPYTGALDLVADYLRKEGHSVAAVDGRTSAGKRRQIFDSFQNDDDPKVLVAHPQTAAHGLTLTRADLTVWYGPVFSLELFEQANNRMNRPGQKKCMTVAMLVGNALEREIYRVLETRGSLQDGVLKMYKETFHA